MSMDEIMTHYQKGVTDRGGCGGPVLITMFLVLLLFVLTGCKTVTSTESYVEKHRIDSLVERLDSVISKSKITEKDSVWHEIVIKELQSIKEKNDTSHTVVVDTAGKVIKETIVITNTKEVNSERDRQEITYLRHSIERMDSTIKAQSEQISRMDSLVQQSHKETVVEKKSWWKGLWGQVKGILIGIVLCLVFVAVMKYRKLS